MDNSRGPSALHATLMLMTAMPHSSAPVVPMTAAEYAALPEDEEIHYELQEGCWSRWRVRPLSTSSL